MSLPLWLQHPIRQTTDRRSQAFHPTTIEIKFQRLSKVEEESDQNSFVPVIMCKPSPEDSPGYVVSVSIIFCSTASPRYDFTNMSLQAKR